MDEGRLDADRREALLLRSGVNAEDLYEASHRAADTWAQRHETNMEDGFYLGGEEEDIVGAEPPDQAMAALDLAGPAHGQASGYQHYDTGARYDNNYASGSGR